MQQTCQRKGTNVDKHEVFSKIHWWTCPKHRRNSSWILSLESDWTRQPPAVFAFPNSFSGEQWFDFTAQGLVYVDVRTWISRFRWYLTEVCGLSRFVRVCCCRKIEQIEMKVLIKRFAMFILEGDSRNPGSSWFCKLKIENRDALICSLIPVLKIQVTSSLNIGMSRIPSVNFHFIKLILSGWNLPEE